MKGTNQQELIHRTCKVRARENARWKRQMIDDPNRRSVKNEAIIWVGARKKERINLQT